MKRKMKRSTKQSIFVALLSILIVGGAAITAYFIMTAQIRATYEAQIANQKAEKEANQRIVYRALTDIPVGTCITDENTERIQVYASQPQDVYLTADELGRTTLVDIPAGTDLMKTMVTDILVSEDVREVLFNVIAVNPNIISNEAVDIRLVYPNGENYIVLSKKNLKNWEGGTSYYLWLNEEEILLMSSAIVDAYLYEGSSLYTAKYIQPNLQEASIVTYVPSEETMALIQMDPNIVQVASRYLETQLRQELEARIEPALANDRLPSGSSGNKYIDGTVNLDPVILEPEKDLTGNYFN